MPIADLFHAIQETGWATDIRESALTYPIIMTCHLTTIGLFGGMILLSDLRLLGWAMRDKPVADVVNGLRLWKRFGIVSMVTWGFLLAASKADSYYPNPYFRIKMTLLALVAIHALVFRRSVYARAAEFDQAGIPPRAKLAAALSLLLWTGLVCCGRWIAYYEPPKGHAVVTSPQLPVLRALR